MSNQQSPLNNDPENSAKPSQEFDALLPGILEPERIETLRQQREQLEQCRASGQAHVYWSIADQLDKCKADIERWKELERNAKIPSEAIAAEQRLVALQQQLASLNSQWSSAEVVEPEAEQVASPESVQAAPAMKRRALIAEYLNEWPSIKADLNEASRNGLDSAKLPKYGMWDVEKAMAWARSQGKLVQKRTSMEPATWCGPITRHQLR